jgi:hypothetical protein
LHPVASERIDKRCEYPWRPRQYQYLFAIKTVGQQTSEQWDQSCKSHQSGQNQTELHVVGAQRSDVQGKKPEIQSLTKSAHNVGEANQQNVPCQTFRRKSIGQKTLVICHLNNRPFEYLTVEDQHRKSKEGFMLSQSDLVRASMCA